MPEIERTEDGSVVFLARAPGQVADNTKNATGASAVRGAASGNNRFDPGSGRFAPKQGAADPVNPVADVNPVPIQRSGVPQGVTQDQWERRMDVVREAARKVNHMDEQQAKDFLNGRVTNLDQVDVGQFIMDVRAQMLDDFTDTMDHRLRGQNKDTSNRSVVRLAAPRGWLKSMYGTMQDDEAVRVAQRLINRGHDRQEVLSKFVANVGDDTRQKKIEAALGESVKLSDLVDAAMDDLAHLPELEPEPERESQLSEETVLKFAELFKEMPQPEIHVHPQITVEAPAKTKRIVNRDDSGLIESVEEVDV